MGTLRRFIHNYLGFYAEAFGYMEDRSKAYIALGCLKRAHKQALLMEKFRRERVKTQ